MGCTVLCCTTVRHMTFFSHCNYCGAVDQLVHHFLGCTVLRCTTVHHLTFFSHCNYCGAVDHVRKACQRLLLQEKLGTMREKLSDKEKQKKPTSGNKDNKKNDGKRNERKTLRLCTFCGDEGHTEDDCEKKDNIEERYVPSLAISICYILFKVM